MQNIEIKSVLRDRPAVEKRLEDLGAEHVLVMRQRDTFYAVPRGWLKLRQHAGGQAEVIAYDRATDNVGARPSDYHLAVIEDAELWKTLLGSVLEVDAVVSKERTLWLFEHTRIHLDRVEDLGDYLELETAADEIGPEAAHEETARIIAALGLDEGDFLSLPYRDLLK